MLITKAENGSPSTDGMKLLLKTLRDADVPVKISELFLTAFCSPSVWRHSNETMQRCIVRRELYFKKLEETSPETKVSKNVRSMMLLIFRGLDAKEQVSVLRSCGNQYDFEKISQSWACSSPKLLARWCGEGVCLGVEEDARVFAFVNYEGQIAHFQEALCLGRG